MRVPVFNEGFDWAENERRGFAGTARDERIQLRQIFYLHSKLSYKIKCQRSIFHDISYVIIDICCSDASKFRTFESFIGVNLKEQRRHVLPQYSLSEKVPPYYNSDSQRLKWRRGLSPFRFGSPCWNLSLYTCSAKGNISVLLKTHRNLHYCISSDV